MPQFPVNPTRFTPYLTSKFQLWWDGRAVAGISKCSALTRTTEPIEFYEGGGPSSPRMAPGRSKFAAITLERGVTQDREFERWASRVWNFSGGPGKESSLRDFRKDIMLKVYNEAGQLVLGYKIYRCWVSEYQALPEFDASANAIAIQHIKLENEGWERDTEIVEPAEPSYTEPPL